MPGRPSSTQGRGRFPKETRGVFITLEGIEGSGKTSQCHRLAGVLREEGFQVLETREPGGTPFAEQIRDLLLTSPPGPTGHEPITPECETMLILACRSQHTTHVLAPALRQGTVVLCDRFTDSTLAYQGYGRGIDRPLIKKLNTLATGGLTPDLTFLFDLPVLRGLTRRRNTHHQNRIDREAKAFHERVRAGFLELARLNPRRIVVLDGRQSPERLADQVARKVKSVLARKAPRANAHRGKPRGIKSRSSSRVVG